MQQEVTRMSFWKLWIEAAEFVLEAQGVIAMRLLKIAGGGSDAAAEWTRMIAEKIEAATDANTAGALALARGRSVESAAKSAMAPIERRVRANHARLSLVK
jgi:hypothetical protein